MAQAGYTPISLYYSTTAAAVPTSGNLASGELAINIVDGKLYYKSNAGVVTLLAGATSGPAGGSNTQVQFNSSGILSGSANLTWDGTTLSSTQVNITGQGTLRLQDTTGGEYVGLRSPSALGASYTLTFPADDGTSGQALITDGSGVLSWSTAASGDVYGPGSSTDNAVARFDSTTGKLLQNSVVLIGDTGDVSGVGTLSAATLTLTNALGTAYGGTGLTSFTSGGVVYASSTSALATGSALVFNGTNLGVGVTTANASSYGHILSVSTSIGLVPATQNTVGSIVSLKSQLGSSGGESFIQNQILTFTNASNYTTGLTFNIRTGASEAEQMRLTSTGLGIGTSSPTNKLDVLGSGDGEIRLRAGSDPSITFSETTANKNWKLKPSAGDFYWQYSATAYNSGYSALMSLTSAGNLSNVGNLSVNTGGLSTYFRASGTAYTQIGDNQTLGAGTAFVIGSSTPYLAFNTAGSEKMRISSAGDVGIGTTSAGAKLEVVSSGSASTVILRNSSSSNATYSELLFAPFTGTTAAAASIRNLYATNNSSNLTFATTNTAATPQERMRIDNLGNVGIGTSSPSEKLAVAGNVTADIYKLRSNQSAPSSTDAFIYRPADNTIGFGTASAEKMRLDVSGNLGIGTSSPNGTLQLSRNASSGNFLVFDDTRSGFGDWAVYKVGSNDLTFGYDTTAGSAPTQALTLAYGGNLGLGVTPSAWGSNWKAFDEAAVGSLASTGSGSGDLNLTFNAYNDNTNWRYKYTGDPATRYSTSSGQHRWFNAASGTAGNAITFTQAMTLDASGNLRIGTTAALFSANERVSINGATGEIGQTIYANGTSSIGLLLFNSVATGATSGKQISFVNSSGTEVGSVTSNGSATLYNTTSDQRLKENIQDAESSSSLIDAIQVRQFDWKSDGSHTRYGFVAQELVTVAPEAVHQPADAEEMMSVDYSKLVPMLVKEIQSLKARLDAANL